MPLTGRAIGSKHHLIASAALQEPITDTTCNRELNSKDEQKNQAELDLEVHEVNLPHKCPTKELATSALLAALDPLPATPILLGLGTFRRILPRAINPS